MLTILAYGMIIAFLYLLTKKKLTVYTALILVPIVFGLAACLLTGKDPILIFDWIKKGLFFSQNPEGVKGSQPEPLSQTIFKKRLTLLEQTRKLAKGDPARFPMLARHYLIMGRSLLAAADPAKELANTEKQLGIGEATGSTGWTGIKAGSKSCTS